MTAARLFLAAPRSISRSCPLYLGMAKPNLMAERAEASHRTRWQRLPAKLPLAEGCFQPVAKPEELPGKWRGNQQMQVIHLELQEKDFVFQL